jgi:hypothetical protein
MQVIAEADDWLGCASWKRNQGLPQLPLKSRDFKVLATSSTFGPIA